MSVDRSINFWEVLVMSCNSCNSSGFCAFGSGWWWIIILVIIVVIWGNNSALSVGSGSCGCGCNDNCGCGC